MGLLDEYKIPLRDMQDVVRTYNFAIDDEFFTAIDAPAVKRGNLDVELSIKKNIDSFTLSFYIEGDVVLSCDRCLGDMDYPIETEGELIVKLGDHFSDDDEIIIIPEEEGRIDISWYIYEWIALDIPIHHVHEDGECDETMLRYLCQYQTEERTDATAESEEKEQQTDPRWDALKKILNNN